MTSERNWLNIRKILSVFLFNETVHFDFSKKYFIYTLWTCAHGHCICFLLSLCAGLKGIHIPWYFNSNSQEYKYVFHMLISYMWNVGEEEIIKATIEYVAAHTSLLALDIRGTCNKASRYFHWSSVAVILLLTPNVHWSLRIYSKVSNLWAAVSIQASSIMLWLVNMRPLFDSQPLISNRT